MVHKLFVFLTLLIILGACAARYTSSPTLPTSVSKNSSALRQAAEAWVGTPYRYGGNSRQGIDCSGLVYQLYKQVFGLTLPRQANAQRQMGYSVHYPYLKPGDLIFFRFRTEERIEHVGVYLGQNQFVHASTQRGVVIDRLDNPYYQRHIVVIKRLLR